MKKIYYSILVFSAILFNSSCSGFLDEDLRGQLVGDGTLSTQVGLESALTGAYKGWGYTWNYGFNNGWATEMTIGGDDLTCPPGEGNTQEYDRLYVKSTNSSSPSVYRGCYKAIQGANNIILNYEKTSGDAATIKIMAGEAYFIRAFSYFWLVRCHGKVPLIMSPEYDPELLLVQNAEISQIYDLIVADLTKAETMLGDTKRDFGRPNAGTAKAMLAEVYLHMAGWPLKDTSKYALAAAKAKEVIDNHAKYGFGFESSYDVLFENDENKIGGNAEDIFVIPCNKSDWSITNAMYGYWAYPGELGGWDVVFSEYTFYNEFPAGARKDATFATTFKKQDGTVLTWNQLRYNHPYYKKLMKSEKVADYYNYASSIPMRMLRYSQTALTYAEAKARSGGPDALSYQLVNTIRTRAGLSSLSGLSADDFAKAVVQERAWELCGERVRWFDMVRLEMVADVFAKRDSRDNQPLRAISQDVYLFPIPEHDVLLNPNIK